MPIHKKRILEQLEKGVSLENIASWNNISLQKLQSILSAPDFRKGVPLKLAHALVETKKFEIGMTKKVKMRPPFSTRYPRKAWEFSRNADKFYKTRGQKST